MKTAPVGPPVFVMSGYPHPSGDGWVEGSAFCLIRRNAQAQGRKPHNERLPLEARSYYVFYGKDAAVSGPSQGRQKPKMPKECIV
jgi:hypothetical protein